MKPIVLYATKSGNTEKVAKAIACELRCPCTKISSASKSFTLNLDDYDMMFVGTGIYRGKPHADLQDFLSEMQMKTRKPFALFMTWFGWGKGIADKNVIETVKALVETKRQTMLNSQYICLGEGSNLGIEFPVDVFSGDVLIVVFVFMIFFFRRLFCVFFTGSRASLLLSYLD